MIKNFSSLKSHEVIDHGEFAVDSLVVFHEEDVLQILTEYRKKLTDSSLVIGRELISLCALFFSV